MSETSNAMKLYGQAQQGFKDKITAAGLEADKESIFRLFDELFLSFDLSYIASHSDRIIADINNEMKSTTSNISAYLHFLADDLEKIRQPDEDTLQPVYENDGEFANLVTYIRQNLEETGRRWQDIVEPDERFSDMIEPDPLVPSSLGLRRAM